MSDIKRFWIKWVMPSGESGYVLRSGEDTIEGRYSGPVADAKERASALESTSYTETRYSVEPVDAPLSLK